MKRVLLITFAVILLAGSVASTSSERAVRLHEAVRKGNVQLSLRVGSSGVGDIVEARIANTSNKPLALEISRGELLAPKSGEQSGLVVGRSRTILLRPKASTSCLIRAYHLLPHDHTRPKQMLDVVEKAKLDAEKTRKLTRLMSSLRGDYQDDDIRACQAAIWWITVDRTTYKIAQQQGWSPRVAAAAEGLLQTAGLMPQPRPGELAVRPAVLAPPKVASPRGKTGPGQKDGRVPYKTPAPLQKSKDAPSHPPSDTGEKATGGSGQDKVRSQTDDAGGKAIDEPSHTVSDSVTEPPAPVPNDSPGVQNEDREESGATE